ncbi:MAG: N-acetylmuramoyl-L-alanine amidase [Anaerolineae bacterium]
MFSSQRERKFEETGYSIRGDFLAFWERYGEEVLGPPITDVLEEDGEVAQYFERVALESPAPGQVRLKPLGREVLRLRDMIHQPRPMVIRPPIIDLVYDLPRHAERRYETRRMAQIQQLVIHHTGAAPALSVEAIAKKHVEELGWPGMGYHFIIDAAGQIYQTNNLTTVSFHARHANSTTVGIAFSGNFDAAVPADAQLESGGRLCAYLLRELSLPVENIRGHNAFVSTGCPGGNWTEGAVWRDALLEQIRSVKRFGS